MKKLLFVFIILVLIIPSVQSQEPYRMGSRAHFEIGLFNMDIGIANNVIRPFDFFQKGKTVELDLNGLNNGFYLGFDANIQPLYFNIMLNNGWGFGLDIARVTAYGNIELSGNLLQFNKTAESGEKFGAGAAAFAEIGIPVFFHIKNVWEKRALKINVKPAGYIPMIYAVPDMTYYFTERNKKGEQGAFLGVDYNVKIFTPAYFSSENGVDMSTFNAGSALGFDFSLGAEYPLFPWIDVGIDFINIPLFGSRLSHYMLMEDSIWIDTSKIGLSHLLGSEEFPDGFYHMPGNFDPLYGTKEQMFFRPFKMLLSADFRLFQLLDLFNFPVISILPVLGFSINPVFVNVASIEAALRFQVDLANLFITRFGFAYEDQLWKNGINFILNLRAFQFDFGISMQSQDFVKSWQANGIRVSTGLKFGW